MAIEATCTHLLQVTLAVLDLKDRPLCISFSGNHHILFVVDYQIHCTGMLFVLLIVDFILIVSYNAEYALHGNDGIQTG